MSHTPDEALQRPQAMLVVLPSWVGDFVMATPTLRAVRERFAMAKITFLMNPNLRDLVRGGDWMDECVEWPAGPGSHEATKPRSHEGKGENAETPKRRDLRDEGTEGRKDEGTKGRGSTADGLRVDPMPAFAAV